MNMSTVTKINCSQKEILGNYMVIHTDLAKGILPNTSQGRARANELWEELTLKLNASGPPIKDAKMWRKVYADQKQNAKKKLTFNKSSKKRTGGGPYEEKYLSHVEEQIVVAAGIELAVDGLKSVKSFGSCLKNSAVEDAIDSDECYMFPSTSQGCNYNTSILSASCDDDMSENIHPFIEIDDCEIEEKPSAIKPRAITKECTKLNSKFVKETKTTLLKKNLISTDNYHKDVLDKLDKVIEIKNKELRLKEKEIELSGQLIEIKRKTLKIREMELELRKKELAMSYNNNFIQYE